MIMNNEGPFGIIGEIIPCEEISDHAVLSRTPLVSVHMITYNHEPYIAQAIKGVLQQKTDFQIELIIGEDCSTDRTLEIVQRVEVTSPDGSVSNVDMTQLASLISGAEMIRALEHMATVD